MRIHAESLTLNSQLEDETYVGSSESKSAESDIMTAASGFLTDSDKFRLGGMESKNRRGKG